MNDEIAKIKIKNLDKLYEYRQKLYEKPILKDLFIEITSRCNARCEHCGSSCGDKIIKEEISAEALKKTLLEISNHYNAKDILLNVTGGEPLMRKDLFDIMEYADKLGFRWGMTSNGMLITDEVLNKMNETHMETISISLDGLKNTHESFRKVPNSFDKIIDNIKKLQKVPSIKIVQVTTVANKKNLHELEELYNLMKELKIISWRVINVDPIGRAKGNKDILLDKEEYKYLFNFIKEKREENLMNVEYGCSHYLDIPLEKEIRDTYFFCITGLYVASILSNGDIFVCPNVERRPEFVQGNIKTDSFVDVWENKFKIFRTDNRTSCEKCKKCSKWKYCLGDSFHTFNFDDCKPNFCIKDIYGENKNMENTKEDDYNIDSETNVPQKVYAIPDFLNKQKTRYIYEFIPYEKIGPISLNKTDKKNFVQNGVEYLSESRINQVSCKPTFIDNPESIKRGRNDDELIFIIDGKDVIINYYYDNVLESLNAISNDFIEFEYTDTHFPTKGAYSKKLGIIIFGCKDERCYFTFKIWILGKNEFEKFVDDIKYNLSKPVITITSKLSKFVLNKDSKEEFTQILEIRDNGSIIFDAYDFDNKQKRHDYVILEDEDTYKIINDIKIALDSIEIYPVSKDGDNWKIEININNKNYTYNGNISNIIEKNKEISKYIRNLVKFKNLILLDGDK